MSAVSAFIPFIQTIGFSNSECLSFTELQADPEPQVRTAYCASRYCAGQTYSRRGIEKKDVSQSDHSCPDCHSVLFWNTERKKRRRAS